MTELPAVFSRGAAIAAALPPLSMVTKSGSYVARAICTRCAGKQEEKVGHKMGALHLRLYFESLGWNVDEAGQATCPHCIRNYRPTSGPRDDGVGGAAIGAGNPRNETSKVIPMSQPASSGPPAPEAEKECRPPSMLELRNIMAALEAYFVDGVWTEGKSDQAIASELDLPRRMVEKVRLEAFGHVRNKELEELKGAAQGLKAQLTDLFRRLANLEAKVLK